MSAVVVSEMSILSPEKTGETTMRAWGLFVAGWVLILAGSWLASAVQTAGGVTVSDVRFPGAGG